MSIVTSPGIKDGKPVIQGSRVTVEAVVERFYGLGRSTEQISDDLGVSAEDVEEALRFYNSQLEDKAEMEA